MKTCPCGGSYHRHGQVIGKSVDKDGQRYRCRECGKTITVRNGKVVTSTGPRIADWRTQGSS